MQGNVSLRGLEYLHSHDEEKSLPMLVASGLADHLLVQPEAKRFALAQDTLHDDPSETLTAVETAKGVLLFEYSGFGKTCCHAYIQHLADRFFITDEEKPEFVNLYKLTRPDAEVVKAFQASPMPSPYIQTLFCRRKHNIWMRLSCGMPGWTGATA